MENKLNVGFARVNVTPPMGINIAGYFQIRLADGVLDELECNALALTLGEQTAVVLSIDNCGIKMDVLDDFRHFAAEQTGLPYESIIVNATHTHTGPCINRDDDTELVIEYRQFLKRRVADAAMLALADRKPARMGYRVGTAPNISFVRRFIMKDGSIRTNPGVNNPDIDKPIGEVDERVNVVRFDREGAESIVLVNFGDHPDTVGGCKISADWPGFVRKTLEAAIDNCKCIFLNGVQGDVNHVNVHPVSGDLNDMFMDFDDVSRGYGHARFMGRVVAGAVLQVYDKVEYVDVDRMKVVQKTIHIASNMPAPEDLPKANEINDYHQAGRDDMIPFKGMELTTVVAEAERMLKLANGPEYFDMYLTGLVLGDLVLIGIPGEPFTDIGLALKKAEGWKLVLPCCLTNGDEGYFPTRSAYDEGGYEARSSFFKPGVAESIIEEGLILLNELR